MWFFSGSEIRLGKFSTSMCSYYFGPIYLLLLCTIEKQHYFYFVLLHAINGESPKSTLLILSRHDIRVLALVK